MNTPINSAVVAGALYALPPQAGHPPWVVRVTRVSPGSVEMTVDHGQRRGKSKRFRMNRDRFERNARPASNQRR